MVLENFVNVTLIACIHTHPHNGEAVSGLVQWRSNPHKWPLAITHNDANEIIQNWVSLPFVVIYFTLPLQRDYGVVALANKEKRVSFVLSRKQPMHQTL